MIILVYQVTVREVASLGGLPQISKQLHTLLLPVATSSQCQHTETVTSKGTWIEILLVALILLVTVATRIEKEL